MAEINDTLIKLIDLNRKDPNLPLSGFIAFDLGVQIDKNYVNSDLANKDAVNVFWSFYEPNKPSETRWVYGDWWWNVFSAIDEPVLTLVLKELEDIEYTLRVPYEPDKETDSFVYVHVALLRALLLRKRDGYSDDVMQLLTQVLHHINRFHLSQQFTYAIPDNFTAELCYGLSWGSLIGLGFIENAKLMNLDGKYQKAFHTFALGMSYISAVFLGSFSEDCIWEEQVVFKDYLPRLDVKPQELVDLFENIRDSDKLLDLRQVIQDCEVIYLTWVDCLKDDEETVHDNKGKLWPWRGYWYFTAGWAEAKMEPDQLLEKLKEHEDEQAKKRIIRYLLEQELWDRLSPRAQSSLIEADKAWFSTKSGRRERLLNELRLAIEDILYPLVWQNLSKWSKDTSINDPKLMEFEMIRKKLEEEHKNPSLYEYESILKTQSLKDMIKSWALSDREREFLLKTLPLDIKNLRRGRKSAEHPDQEEPSIIAPTEIARLFKKTMGIGCNGIIYQLLKLSEKISNMSN
ncbi:MAG: hypothetical protein WC562_05375 [Dehalococcoidia bacterium]